MSIAIGDTVRYSGEFIKGCGYWVAHDYQGEVTVIGGKVAKVLWQDDHESSALLSNLEKYPPVYPSTPWASPSQEDIAIERGMILAEAWSK